MFVHAYNRVEKCKNFCSNANVRMTHGSFKVQRNLLNENLVFQFLGIFAKKCSCPTLLNSIYQFVWSSRLIWYPYCHTLWHFMSYGKCQNCHKMEFYDIFWHLPYDMKCHKVWQYGYQINRLDQTNWYMEFKISGQEHFQQKFSKTEKPNFPIAKSFVF